MISKKLSVAIVGAGIGGMTAAATLRRIGIDELSLKKSTGTTSP